MHVNQTMTGVAIYPPEGRVMIETLINPADSPERQPKAFDHRRGADAAGGAGITDDSGAAYAQFQRAALLEDQVRERTRDLERALDLLNESNARLGDANREAEAARQNLSNAIETVQEGFALFDREDRSGDVQQRFACTCRMCDRICARAGFDDYVAMVSRSPILALPEGEAGPDWAKAAHAAPQGPACHLQRPDGGDHWVQVSEHRTADGGTVILQTDVTDIIRLERQERGKLLDDQARVIRATLDHINQGSASLTPRRGWWAGTSGWGRCWLPMAAADRGVLRPAAGARFGPRPVRQHPAGTR
jgi:two-component system, sensor histidine kinase